MDLPTGPLAGVLGTRRDHECRCHTRVVDGRGGIDRDERGATLVVDANDCPGGGDLAEHADCRRTVVDALTDRDADLVRTHTDGRERVYEGDAATLLLAAGRFVERVADHDEALAERARRNPLAAARECRGRTGPVSRVVAETGLAECAARASTLADALAPETALVVARDRVTAPPSDATVAATWTTATDATVTLYETANGRRYHLRPVESDLSDDAVTTLTRARERLLAADDVAGELDGRRAARRAVRDVATADDPVETLVAVLDKHTRGNGVLDDCFADERVSDVVVSAPVTENPVRVRVDGERVPTNVRLTRRGAAALASRLRRDSGRPLSRASPTLDAVVETPTGHVRAAAVTAPVSDGYGFAFRSHRSVPFRLPDLVANGTLTAEAAGLLSLAVERGAAVVVAGTRGAGKTTLLGALLWELPRTTRTVVIEDTPELPVAALRDEGHDVQSLRVDRDGDGPGLAPTAALRTALRLGEGCLVVGEVRGEEAAALYEAMRVGAAGSAVLGTVHGDGAAAVRERVTTDLGVPETAFAATDLVVTCTAAERRRVASVEEVHSHDGDAHFRTLYDRDPGLVSAGTVERGESTALWSLARPDESYADVRAALDERVRATAAEAGATDDTDRHRPSP